MSLDDLTLPERAMRRLTAFPQQTVVGIGDVMLDQYRRGKVRGLSPEAPVVELLNPGMDERPGGAAVVAWNIGHLGAHVHMVGVVGRDTEARSLKELLDATPGVSFTAVEDAGRPTTLKLRFYHDQFQVLRVSQESREPLSPDSERACQEAVRAHLPSAAALFVEDYGKQLISEALVAFLLEVRQEYPALPVILDPKIGNHSVYRPGMCTLLKPNWEEACALADADPDRADRLAVARMVAERYACDVLVTLGADGALLSERSRGRALHVPTRPREAFDIAGAGDTALAVLTLALAAGAPLLEAAILANVAGGIVVEKSGTAYATVEEMLADLHDRRTAEALQSIDAGVHAVRLS